jgi:hypothetical protein
VLVRESAHRQHLGDGWAVLRPPGEGREHAKGSAKAGCDEWNVPPMKRYIHGCKGAGACEDASDEGVEAARSCRLH